MLLALSLLLPWFATAQDAPALYQEHCASCHGAERLGGQGPVLLPESLGRLRPAEARAVIAQGRSATQMAGFAEVLSSAGIEALARFIYEPPATPPRWEAADIAASRADLVEPGSLPDRPGFDADPMNLFLVVETGDHHVTVLDGDRFAPLARFATRPTLHGGPKFSPDGRFAYLMSRDGWVQKFDMYGLRIVAEVRAGINSRNIALSGDGRLVAVANYLPNTLVLLDAGDLSLLRVIPVVAAGDGAPSRVSAVYDARPRRSFIVAMKDIPEIWEIAWDSDAGSARFAPRRIAVDDPLDDFMFDPAYAHLLGSTRGGGRAVVVDLDAGRPAATVPLEGLPHLGSGITWMRDGHRVMATPHLNRAQVSVIDMRDWRLVATIPTGGPGFFMRSHAATPYAWTDGMMGPARDTITIIDKRTLRVARTLTPSPGQTAAHVEFTRDGRFALVSVWEDDGALVVYDAGTFEEVARLPMRRPSGKYNVGNKTGLEEGTSH